jgi:chloride channel protein, CIC family
MIDPQEKPISYLRVMTFIILLGIASALITFGFIELVNVMIRLIWEQAKLASGLEARVFTLLICTLGGLLVSISIRFFGDHPAIFSELMQEFGKSGRFDYRNAPGIVITSFISLIAGASLGPEAALADACGGLGTWTADRLKLNVNETRTMGYGGLSAMLAAFITNPFSGALLSLESAQGGATGGQLYFWTLLPSLLASAVATLVFVALSGSFFNPLYSFPAYSPRLVDLLWAVPFCLIGGLAGLLFTRLFKWLSKVMLPLKEHKWLRGIIGGLGMGMIGALFPLTLFSGETQTIDLIQRSAQIGFTMLIVLAISKLFATSLLLATGWKGGYIFPIMFAGVALGMAGHLLFPGVPVAVTVSTTMAGVFVTALKAPLFAALFTLTLVEAATAPAVAVAVLVSALLIALLSFREAKIASQVNGEPRGAT